jgi:D-serine deaminase-like pyridoxal phosphate-dependent protein
LFSGGYVASGPAQKNRLPKPAWPEGLSLLGTEGAGEVQTPVRGPGARELAIGDRVWLRHAKAGELSEHVNELYVVDGADVVAVRPTYRGEGKAFL